VSADIPAAFFSYSREDADFAQRLAEDLKAAGANVWIDQLDITGGEDWPMAIEQAMRRCPGMIVILSPASVGSNQVRAEYHFALNAHKKIIPVFHRDCEIPFHLELFQRVDFRTDYSRGLKALLRALGVAPPLEQSAAAAAASPAAAQEAHLAPTDTGVRRMVAEQVEMEPQRRLAAERARQEEERKRAAERTRRDEEGKRAAKKARLEKAEQKQLADAEKARLEEERKPQSLAAAEKKRLEKVTQERLRSKRARAALSAKKAREATDLSVAEKARLEQAERESSC